MSSKTAHFTREFKIETVRLLSQPGQTAKQIAKDLGIHTSTIYNWKKKYAENPQAAFPGKGKLSADQEEFRRLERENQRLRMERDILKKAMAIFSRQQR